MRRVVNRLTNDSASKVDAFIKIGIFFIGVIMMAGAVAMIVLNHMTGAQVDVHWTKVPFEIFLLVMGGLLSGGPSLFRAWRDK